MRYFALLLFTIAACSSDPSPALLDAQAADAVDVASELAPDVMRDTGGTLDAPDVPVVPDAPAVFDAAVDVALDVTMDATPEVATDAAVGDASLSADVDGSAGPVTYDLGRVYGALEVHVLWLATCAPGDCSVPSVVETVASADCYSDAMGVHFSVGLTGLVPISSDGGAGGSVSAGSRSTLDVRSDVRLIYNSMGQRRNAHVMFNMPAAPGQGGATGIPGRTTSPDRADVWLLGCPVR